MAIWQFGILAFWHFVIKNGKLPTFKFDGYLSEKSRSSGLVAWTVAPPEARDLTMTQNRTTQRCAGRDAPSALEFPGTGGGSRSAAKRSKRRETNTVTASTDDVGVYGAGTSASDSSGLPGQFDRLLLTIPEVRRLLSISRSTIYRRITESELDARKVGRRTLITADSVARFAATLPKLGDAGARTER